MLEIGDSITHKTTGLKGIVTGYKRTPDRSMVTMLPKNLDDHLRLVHNLHGFGDQEIDFDEGELLILNKPINDSKEN